MNRVNRTVGQNPLPPLGEWNGPFQPVFTPPLRVPTRVWRRYLRWRAASYVRRVPLLLPIWSMELFKVRANPLREPHTRYLVR